MWVSRGWISIRGPQLKPAEKQVGTVALRVMSLQAAVGLDDRDCDSDSCKVRPHDLGNLGLRRARIQTGVSPEMSRQGPRGREVRTPDRVERTGAAARNTRREDLVVRIVVERPRKRGSVKGGVDRTPQLSLAK